MVTFFLGVVVSGIFFQFGHIARRRSDEDIERVSRDTNSLRYFLLNYLIKTSKVGLQKNVEDKDEIAKVAVDNKYFSANSLFERRIIYSITPYLTNTMISVGYAALVMALLLLPAAIALLLISITGIGDSIVSYVVMIPIFLVTLLFSPVLATVFTGSIRSVKIIISSGVLRISGGALSVEEERKLKNIKIDSCVKFERMTLYGKHLGFRWFFSDGIGISLENKKFLLSHCPRVLSRVLGCGDLKAIENLLNEELRNA